MYSEPGALPLNRAWLGGPHVQMSESKEFAGQIDHLAWASSAGMAPSRISRRVRQSRYFAGALIAKAIAYMDVWDYQRFVRLFPVKQSGRRTLRLPDPQFQQPHLNHE